MNGREQLLAKLTSGHVSVQSEAVHHVVGAAVAASAEANDPRKSPYVRTLLDLCLGSAFPAVVETTCEMLELRLDDIPQQLRYALEETAAHCPVPPSALRAFVSLVTKLQMSRLPADDKTGDNLVLLVVQQHLDAATLLLDIIEQGDSGCSWSEILPSVASYVLLDKAGAGLEAGVQCRSFVSALCRFLRGRPQALSLFETVVQYLAFYKGSSLAFATFLAESLESLLASYTQRADVDAYLLCPVAQALLDQTIGIWAHLRELRIGQETKKETLSRGEQFAEQESIATTPLSAAVADVTPIVQLVRSMAILHDTITTAAFEPTERVVLADTRAVGKTMAVLAAFLLRSPLLQEQRAVFFILERLLNEKLGNAFVHLVVLPSIVLPVIQCCGSAIPDIKVSASALLARIESLQASSVKFPSSTRDRPMLIPVPSPPVRGQVAAVHLALDSLIAIILPDAGESDQDASSSLEAWLEEVARQIADNTGDTTEVTSFLLAPFLFYSASSIRAAAVRAINAAITAKPSLGVQVLPLVMYQLAREEDSVVQLQLIQLLPVIGRHFICLIPTFTVLEQLSTQRSLQPLCLRLMTQQWEGQGRTFPRLSTELVKAYRGAGQEKATVELRIAVAASVRDICLCRPAKGVEIVKLLSRVLKDSCGAVVALGLEGLRHLCETDCLDFITAWDVISDGVAGEERGEVVAALLALLSVGLPECKEAVDDEDEDRLFRQFADKLWNSVEDKNAAVRLAAVEAMASVIERNSCYLMLDREFGTCMNLIAEENAVVSPPAIGLASTLLRMELKERLRRSVGARGQSFLNKDYTNLQALSSFVEEQIAGGGRQAVFSAFSGASLWSFLPVANKKASSSDRGALVVCLNGNKRKFSELLLDVSTRGSWITQQLAIGGWVRFMASFMSSATALDAYDRDHPADDVSSEQKESTSKDGTGQAVVNVVELARKAIAENTPKSPSAAENSAYALAGLVLSLPDKCKSLVEEIVRESRSSLLSLLESGMEDMGIAKDQETRALAIAVGAMSQALHLTDAESFEEVQTVLSGPLEQEGVASTTVQGGCALGLAYLLQAMAHASGSGRKEESSTPLSGIERVAALHEKCTALVRDTATAAAKAVEETERKERLEKFDWLVSTHLGVAHASIATTDEALLLPLIAELELRLTSSSAVEVQVSAAIAYPTVINRAFHVGCVTNTRVGEAIALLRQYSVSGPAGVFRAAAAFGLCTLVHGSMLDGYSMDLETADAIGSSQIAQLCKADVGVQARGLYLFSLVNLAGGGALVPTSGRHRALRESVRYLGTAFACSERRISWLEKTLHELKRIATGAGEAKLVSFSAWAAGMLGRALPPVYLSTESEVKQLPNNSFLRGLLELLDDSTTSALAATPARRGRALKCLASVPSSYLPRLNWAPMLVSLLRDDSSTLACRLAALSFAVRNVAYATVAELLSTVTERPSLMKLHHEELLLLVKALPTCVDAFATSRAVILLQDIAAAAMERVCTSTQPTEASEMLSALSLALSQTFDENQLLEHLLKEIRACADEILAKLIVEVQEVAQGDRLRFTRRSLALLSTLAPLVERMTGQWLADKLLNADDEGISLTAAVLLALSVGAGACPRTLLLRCRTWCFGVADHRLAVAFAPLFVAPLAENSQLQNRWLLDSLDAMSLQAAGTLLPATAVTGYLLLTWAQAELCRSLAPTRVSAQRSLLPHVCLRSFPGAMADLFGCRPSLATTAVPKLHSLLALCNTRNDSATASLLRQCLYLAA